jgi:serine/threonine protein phosphatase PrpC
MPSSTEKTTKVEASVPTVASSAVSVDVAALTDRGRVRDLNEDAYAVFRLGRYLEPVSTSLHADDLPPRHEAFGYIMVVADGVGGREAGDVASRASVLKTLGLAQGAPHWSLKLDDPETREDELKYIHDRAYKYLALVQADIRRRAQDDPSLAGMGTTYTLAYSVGLELFVMHVGDSRAYLLRGGQLRKITHDHTVAQEYADIGMIRQDEVAGHRLHHVLTRAVSSQGETPIGDFHHVVLATGDRLLLCSDGLTDMASEIEIAEILLARPESERACRALVDLALEHGGKDNITVIVAEYGVG